MQKMHEVTIRGNKKRNNNNNNNSASSINSSSVQPQKSTKQQQQRTGPLNSNVIDEEQQRRIAARAAKAMEKQVRRRRDRRSQFVWGDRKKAIIKRYPDGTQEILVPQNLTPEQEHYEFPPRSRLLKKLASANAERRRMSCLKDENDPPLLSTTLSCSSHHQNEPNDPFTTFQLVSTLSSSSNNVNHTSSSSSFLKQQQQQQQPPPTIQPSIPFSPPKPDQHAMAEWFSSRQPEQQKQLQRSKQQNQKDRQVMAWIRDIENSKSPKKTPQPTAATTPTAKRSRTSSPSTSSHSRHHVNHTSSRRPSPLSKKTSTSHSPLPLLHEPAPIQFRSKAGKRWAHASGYAQPSSLSPLAPPPEEDSARKHYVPRTLLRRAGQRRDVSCSTSSSLSYPLDQFEELDYPETTQIQAAWQEYHAVASSPTSKVSGMNKLMGMLHQSLAKQQRLANERYQHLESLLNEEKRQREHAWCYEQHHQLSKRDSEKRHQRLEERMYALEQSMSKESLARQRLETDMSNAMRKLSTLESSIEKQHRVQSTTNNTVSRRTSSTTTPSVGRTTPKEQQRKPPQRQSIVVKKQQRPASVNNSSSSSRKDSVTSSSKRIITQPTETPPRRRATMTTISRQSSKPIKRSIPK